MRQRSRAMWAAIRSVIGLDECLLILALVLVGIGFWQIWKPGAFLVTGLVLLWLTIPSRASFIITPPPDEKAGRKR